MDCISSDHGRCDDKRGYIQGWEREFCDSDDDEAVAQNCDAGFRVSQDRAD